MKIVIALDVMGGDHGPSEIIPAAMHSLKKNKNLSLLLVGKEKLIKKELENNSICDFSDRIKIINASEVVEMHEAPSQALRGKKDSSMRVAIEQVKEGRAGACVSAGNTGALMATARFVLKMLPGIDRPAICTTLPGIKGSTHVMDLGANIDSSSKQLFQFAIMGTQLTSAIDNKKNPTVALLNVGEEEIKGNEQVKGASELLSASSLNYIGYVEGNDIYTGNIDVIICDGFVGNIALKASEGLSVFLRHHAKSEFNSSIYSKLVALLSLPILNRLKNKIDPKLYNGASLLGLKGIVIKSHGSADSISFSTAINKAIIEVEKNVPDKIMSSLANLSNH